MPTFSHTSLIDLRVLTFTIDSRTISLHYFLRSGQTTSADNTVNLDTPLQFFFLLREIDKLIRIFSNDWHFNAAKRTEQAVRSEVNTALNILFPKMDKIYATVEELKALKHIGALNLRAPHAMLVTPFMVINLLRHFSHHTKALIFESILLNISLEAKQTRQTILSLKSVVYKWNEAHGIAHDHATSAQLLDQLLNNSSNKNPYPPPWAHHFGSNVPVLDMKSLSLLSHAFSHPVNTQRNIWNSLTSPAETSNIISAGPLNLPSSIPLQPTPTTQPIAHYEYNDSTRLPPGNEVCRNLAKTLKLISERQDALYNSTFYDLPIPAPLNHGFMSQIALDEAYINEVKKDTNRQPPVSEHHIRYIEQTPIPSTSNSPNTRMAITKRSPDLIDSELNLSNTQTNPNRPQIDHETDEITISTNNTTQTTPLSDVAALFDNLSLSANVVHGDDAVSLLVSYPVVNLNRTLVGLDGGYKSTHFTNITHSTMQVSMKLPSKPTHTQQTPLPQLPHIGNIQNHSTTNPGINYDTNHSMDSSLHQTNGVGLSENGEIIQLPIITDNKQQIQLKNTNPLKIYNNPKPLPFSNHEAQRNLNKAFFQGVVTSFTLFPSSVSLLSQNSVDFPFLALCSHVNISLILTAFKFVPPISQKSCPEWVLQNYPLQLIQAQRCHLKTLAQSPHLIGVDEQVGGDKEEGEGNGKETKVNPKKLSSSDSQYSLNHTLSTTNKQSIYDLAYGIQQRLIRTIFLYPTTQFTYPFYRETPPNFSLPRLSPTGEICANCKHEYHQFYNKVKESVATSKVSQIAVQIGPKSAPNYTLPCSHLPVNTFNSLSSTLPMRVSTDTKWKESLLGLISKGGLDTDDNYSNNDQIGNSSIPSCGSDSNTITTIQSNTIRTPLRDPHDIFLTCTTCPSAPENDSNPTQLPQHSTNILPQSQSPSNPSLSDNSSQSSPITTPLGGFSLADPDFLVTPGFVPFPTLFMLAMIYRKQITCSSTLSPTSSSTSTSSPTNPIFPSAVLSPPFSTSLDSSKSTPIPMFSNYMQQNPNDTNASAPEHLIETFHWLTEEIKSPVSYTASLIEFDKQTLDSFYPNDVAPPVYIVADTNPINSFSANGSSKGAQHLMEQSQSPSRSTQLTLVDQMSIQASISYPDSVVVHNPTVKQVPNKSKAKRAPNTALPAKELHGSAPLLSQTISDFPHHLPPHSKQLLTSTNPNSANTPSPSPSQTISFPTPTSQSTNTSNSQNNFSYPSHDETFPYEVNANTIPLYRSMLFHLEILSLEKKLRLWRHCGAAFPIKQNHTIETNEDVSGAYINGDTGRGLKKKGKRGNRFIKNNTLKNNETTGDDDDDDDDDDDSDGVDVNGRIETDGNAATTGVPHTTRTPLKMTISTGTTRIVSRNFAQMGDDDDDDDDQLDRDSLKSTKLVQLGNINSSTGHNNPHSFPVQNSGYSPVDSMISGPITRRRKLAQVDNIYNDNVQSGNGPNSENNNHHRNDTENNYSDATNETQAHRIVTTRPKRKQSAIIPTTTVMNNSMNNTIVTHTPTTVTTPSVSTIHQDFYLQISKHDTINQNTFPDPQQNPIKNYNYGNKFDNNFYTDSLTPRSSDIGSEMTRTGPCSTNTQYSNESCAPINNNDWCDFPTASSYPPNNSMLDDGNDFSLNHNNNNNNNTNTPNFNTITNNNHRSTMMNNTMSNHPQPNTPNVFNPPHSNTINVFNPPHASSSSPNPSNNSAINDPHAPLTPIFLPQMPLSSPQLPPSHLPFLSLDQSLEREYQSYQHQSQQQLSPTFQPNIPSLLRFNSHQYYNHPPNDQINNMDASTNFGAYNTINHLVDIFPFGSHPSLDGKEHDKNLWKY